MQDRTRKIVWSGIALGALAAGACTHDGQFSDAEAATLRTYTLTALPVDESNVYADRADVARLGKQLYFEPRFSGALGAYHQTGITGSLGAPGERGKIACASCHDPGHAGADRRSLPEIGRASCRERV